MRNLLLLGMSIMVFNLSACSILGTQTLSDDYLNKKYSTPDTQYIPFKGGKLRTEDKGEGPVIVLLHGLMASANAWDSWYNELTTHYRVIRMDLPGWALSDNPTPKQYNPEIHKEAVLAVLKNKGIKKATLVGHSFGGYLSWNLAAEHPDIVERLVIIGGLSFPQRIRVDAKLLGLPIIKQSARQMAPKPIVHYAINSMLVNNKNLSRTERQMYFDFLMRHKVKSTMSNAINWYIRYPSKNTQPDPKLLNLQQPLMTFWGKKDVWVNYKDSGSQWQKHYPNAWHVAYPDAGHLVVDEKPRDSLKRLLKFLDQTNAQLGY